MDPNAGNSNNVKTLLKQQLPGFRDLGGLPVELKGCRRGRIKPGLVFRSGRLSALQDQSLLEKLSLGCILDLRSQDEREEHPDPPLAGVHYETASASTRVLQNPLSLDQVITLFKAAEKGEADTHEYMMKVYSRFPETLARAIALSIHYLADPDAKALLIHCTGGKDRTGFTVAVLQKLLGVPEAEIFTDYCSSGFHGEALEAHGIIYAQKFTKWGVSIAPRLTYPLLSPHADFLSAAFQTVEVQYGGWDSYIQNYLKIPDSTIQVFRERLVRINF